LIRTERPESRLRKVVPNTPEGMTTLLTWVKDKAKCDDIGAFHAVLEATGPYHEIAAQALFDAACKVSVVNPAYTKSFAQSLGVKTKTDHADAETLARYAMLVQPPAWQPPPPQYRQLQTLQTRKQAVETDLQRERNRLEKQEATRGEPLVVESIRRMIQHLETEHQVLELALETHVQAHPDLSRDRGLLQSIQGVGA
jgi:transposase